MLTRLCVSVALCLLVLVRIDARQPSTELELSTEDRQVIEVVLRGNRTRGPVLDTTWPMCIEKTQQPCFSLSSWNDPQVWVQVPDASAMRAALVDRNGSSWRLGPFTAYPTVPGAALRALLALPDPKGVTAAYPDLRSVIQIGAPGFSANRQRALVYMESRCTSRLCSEGSMMLVERDGTGWRSRGLWGWGSAA